jgi:dihydroneopterin aldolase
MTNPQNYVQTVALKDVKCYGYHGFYAEEQLTGIYFLLDVTVTFVPGQEMENLDKTVNYEVLNSIILEEMKIPKKLLETVVKNILDQIILKYAFLKSAEVSIKKLNPPMPGQVGHSFVQLAYHSD